SRWSRRSPRSCERWRGSVRVRKMRRVLHSRPEDFMQAMTMRQDTKAWRAQVWISFLLAALPCAIGLAWLPGREIDRAFMVMGYVFCTTAAFALAKFVRDNERRAVDTPLWRVVVWGGFFVAMALTG